MLQQNKSAGTEVSADRAGPGKKDVHAEAQSWATVCSWSAQEQEEKGS